MARTRYPGISRVERTRGDGSVFTVFRLEVYSDGKRVHRSNHDTITEARNAQLQVLGELEDAKPEGSSKLFAVAFEEWLTTHPHRESSQETYRSRSGPVLKALGRKTLGECTRADIVALVADLAPRKGSTIRVTMRPVKGVFDDAVDNGLLVASPWQRIRFPKDHREPVVPLTHEEVNALLEAAPYLAGKRSSRSKGYPYLPGAVAAGIGVGTRVSETFGIQRQDILGVDDLTRRRVQGPEVLVRNQVHRTKSRGLTAPKSIKRAVPLSPGTHEAFMPYLHRTGPIFLTWDGQLVGRSSFEGSWRLLREAVGLPEERTWHDLRHYYASTLIEAGVPITSISTWLGHADSTITLGIYGHLMQGTEGRGRDAVDQARQRGGIGGGLEGSGGLRGGSE